MTLRQRFVAVGIVLCSLLMVGCAAATPAAAPSATPVPALEATEAPAPSEIPATLEPETGEMTLPVVMPVLETHEILDIEEGDIPEGARLGDLDDPAIWLHPTDPAQSIVAGVMKDGGLEVYDLEGNVLQSIQPDGVRYNNIDIGYNFPLVGESVDIMVASDRYQDRFVIFKVNSESRELEDITEYDTPLLFTSEGEESDEETTAYGVALYHSTTTDKWYAFASRRDTTDVAQFEIMDNGSGAVTWSQVRSFTLPEPEAEDVNVQVEGMVADSELGVVYMGQEGAGIWKVNAEPDAGDEPVLIHPLGEESHLTPDVEGLTLYYADNGTGYLLASSQGDNTFAVYTREGDNTYIGSFQVGANGDIDGSEECDGAMVLNVPLGDRFPQGLLVVQDGGNDPEVLVEDDGEMENVSTNFKYVPWEAVATPLQLKIDTTSYSPR